MPLLFSYGTLQDEAVQQSTFGRRLESKPDALLGYEQSMLTVGDPAFVASSGSAEHAVVRTSDDPGARVPGVALEVTDAELEMADAYEPEGYVRVRAALASGREAWVYVGSDSIA